jgi:hypothetical protein
MTSTRHDLRPERKIGNAIMVVISSEFVCFFVCVCVSVCVCMCICVSVCERVYDVCMMLM